MEKLTDMEKKNIEKEANELLKKYCKDTQNGVDIVALAKKMGFVVGEADLPDSEDGFIMVNKEANKILGFETQMLIVVNRANMFVHKCFVIAHEIGHFILHGNNTNTVFAHRENRHGKDENENDADYFAACLLMPAESFRKQYIKIKGQKRYDESINELAMIFNVPIESVLRRIGELDLVK